ncbi:MAG: hypothetical protein NC341_04265 [Blautia sp.]|nr:hypothetical protein [Blautia sp.]MCM1200850.1 hypothetical protein [Bacteroides fragilis]
MEVSVKYGNEGMDCKKYFLLFLRKAWAALLAALIGAALGGGIYFFHHVVLDSSREYRAESKIYLDFAPDESGEIYQAYNGYTWNDLMAANPILDGTMAHLPDGYTEEEVISATKAEILSDLRLLTITITTSSPERTAEILKATDLSLVELGERAKEFHDIQIYRETEPEMAVADPRLLQAALVGSALALAAALLAMALYYVLDDKIYVPGDLKCVTELPFVGFCFGEAPGAAKSRLRESLQNDFEKNRAYLAEKTGALTILVLEKKQTIAEQAYADLRKADGILLAIPYGEMDRTTLGYRIGQLTLQECRLAGVLIQNADMRLLKWYYNHL